MAARRGKKKSASRALAALALEGSLEQDRKPAYLLLGDEAFLREEALAMEHD